MLLSGLKLMETVAVPNSRWSVPLLLTLAIAVSVAVLGYARFLLHQNRIDAALFFGGAPPTRLDTLLSVRIPGGKLGEFFDPDTKQKLSLVLADRPVAGREQASVGGLMKMLDIDRRKAGPVQEVDGMILKYAAAQFSILAAGNVAPTEVPIAEWAVAAERFETTRSANYLMGVINLEQQQLLFLALRKGEPVDSALVGELLEKVPGVKERLRSQPS